MRNYRFCVVGDIILDHYRFLAEYKLSPEAPVIIFRPQYEEYRLGGAANVANNIHAMGFDVVLYGVSGEEFGSKAGSLMKFEHHVVTAARMTTVKERLITKRQQVARIDSQDTSPITSCDEKALMDGLELDSTDVLVISDYGHGVMTPSLCSRLMGDAISRGIPVVVNSKALDTLSKYTASRLLILNLQEARDITRDCGSTPSELARRILGHGSLGGVALTMGNKGILLANGDGCSEFPPMDSSDEEVVDVTGAGDTVTAAVAAGVAVGMPCASIMELANIAAGIVVRKRGVSTASIDEIRRHADVIGIKVKI